jgi:trimeric autotransporter adhesin
MNKRILFSLIGLISLACTAMAQPTFRVEDTMANKGDSVEIDITADDYIDIVGGQFSMNYDSLVLQYRRLKNLNPVLSPPFVAGPPDIRKGYLRFTWNDPGTQGSTLPDGTRLYTLVFDVIGDPCDSTDVEFSDVPLAIEILESPNEVIELIQDNGVFKVPGQNCEGGGEDDVELIGSRVSGAKGSNVCVQVSVNNFDNISSAQFSINYNNTVLGPAVPQNFNLPDLTTGSFNVNHNAGTVTVGWLDNSTQGVTVPDGTVIFDVCFDVIGNSGQSSGVNFTNNPLVIEFANADDEIVDVRPTNGRVTVSGGGGTGDEVVLTASMERGNPGERVCVDVSVENFVDVAGFQFTMTHNTSIINNAEPQNLNLPDFTAGSSFNINQNTGVITVSWNTFEGVTVPDGTVIFQMCYDVVGNIGQMSPVSFVNSPLEIQFFTIDEDLDVITNNGKVTVGTGEGDLRVEVKDTTVQLDGEGCVRFVVENFDDVDAFQFIIMYDTSKLDTNWTITDFALPSQIFTNEVSPGMIRVLYTDDLGEARSLPDGTTLFKFNFKAIGECDDETDIKPIDDPSFPAQFSNPDEDIPFELIPGTVTISCQMCDAIGINSINNSNVSCNEAHAACDGSINIVPRGGDGTFTYSWTRNGMPFPGNTGVLNNLCAGTYEVTITSCDLSAKFLYTITEPSAITISLVELVNESCQDGIIEVSATGGTGTKRYQWSSGQTTPRITGLTAGTYTVSVTDENDCLASRTFELTGPGELLLAGEDVTNLTCNEEHAACDGAIALTVTGGCEPVSITWTGPNGTTFSGSTITGLCAGNYTVTIRDSQGTQISRTFMVRQPPVIEIRSADITCATPGMSDGSIDPIIVGGTPIGDYDYVWTDSDGNVISTERVLVNRPAGTYTLCITDGVGCEYCEDLVICSSEIGVTVNSVQVSCFGECDATLEVIITGGIPPYVIEWSDGSDELVRENVCVGQYTVTVTDASGSSKTESHTVTGPSELIVDVVELSCASMVGQDGSYEVDIEGGNSPYTVTWCNGSTSPNATNLNVGACNVLVVDANGCQQFVEFRVCGESDPDNCYEGSKIITPNGDNVNEYFVISCVDQFPNTLLIFDRMGQTIYEQRNYDNRWNGFTQSGTEVTDGGYLWVLRVDLPNGTERVFKGVVNVLR